MEHLKIHIENPAGTYKSFVTAGDPESEKYPLKGVTYPVDYGYVEGYTGEDKADLDIFVGSSHLNGYIQVWRLDVPVETKFFKGLNEKELLDVLNAFEPVLISHKVIADQDEFLKKIENFRK